MSLLVTIARIFLIILFGMAGMMKLMVPKKKFEKKMGWAKGYSDGQLKAIGAVEVLGVAGLIFPIWLDILPWLTPLAALGLAVETLFAVALHAKRKETGSIFFAGTVGLIALFVAWQTWTMLG